MDQVHIIRHKVLVEKISQREIARQLNVSRNTIAKYLLQSQPQRQHNKARRAPACQQIEARFAQLLDEWQSRTTKKQRLTGLRLHRQLREEGFEVGKTTVYKLLRQHRRQRLEVFIPLLYQPAEVAQVDFFEVTVDLAGVRRAVWKFVCRLMYSGFDFAWLYERCDQLAFLDGHVRAFRHFQGIPQRMVYDNLTPAVIRRCGLYGFERKLTERFAALSSHYLFEPCFTRPGQGHDKGGVEARGRGIRLQHLTPIPIGDSLQELSQTLLTQIAKQAALTRNAQQQTILELFEYEQSLLRPLPGRDFEARQLRRLMVSSRSTVQIDGALYSVPSRWARLEINAWVGVEEITLSCLGESCTHQRQSSGGKVIRYQHYLPELSRKPQAVRQVAPALLAELGEPFVKLWDLLVSKHGALEAARVLARLLAIIDSHSQEVVEQLLQQMLQQRAQHSGTLLSHQEAVTHIEVPEALRAFDIEAARASDFDYLLIGGEGV
jgi:transposase